MMKVLEDFSRKISLDRSGFIVGVINNISLAQIPFLENKIRDSPIVLGGYQALLLEILFPKTLRIRF